MQRLPSKDIAETEGSPESSVSNATPLDAVAALAVDENLKSAAQVKDATEENERRREARWEERQATTGLSSHAVPRGIVLLMLIVNFRALEAAQTLNVK